MRKVLLLVTLSISIALSGCKKSTDSFLAYTETESANESVAYPVTEMDFLAKDIVVITDSQNSGEDENLDAGAVLLVDITNNNTIYASNAYLRMYPASLVKLLTSFIALEYGDLTDNVKVSGNAVNLPDSRARVCGFKEGDSVSLETLLNCLLVYSGNDAAVAIAEHIAGSEDEFVSLMNKKAMQIGATTSNFENPHGLHNDNQYISAYDMYLIFNKLLKYDIFRSIINKDSYEAVYIDKNGNTKSKTFKSTNRYLTGEASLESDIEVIGGISGTTKKSGSCMILLCKDTDNTEYIAIILNSKDTETLYNQMSYLLSLTGA